MRDFVYPVWTLEEVDNTGVYDIVKKYIALIQSDGKAAHTIAIEIGKIEECHRALIEALGKPERRLVLKIIDAKDHISEDTSLDSFISGFRLAWRMSAELNHYDDERPARCQAAEKPGARFTLKKEDDEQ